MHPKAMAMAYDVMKRNRGKRMSKGGEVSNEKLHPGHAAKLHSPMAIVASIRAKRMAEGGMAGEPDEDDLFSTGEDDSDQAMDLGDETYPDPDDTQHDTDVNDEPPMKRRLSRVFEMVRKRHMGG